MSQYAFLDTMAVGEIASNHGWGGVVRWVNNIPWSQYEALTHLAVHGYSTRLDDLTSDIRKAMTAHSPMEMGVAQTLVTLLEVLNSRRSTDRVLSISDGSVCPIEKISGSSG
jgi:hypothetical protein